MQDIKIQKTIFFSQFVFIYIIAAKESEKKLKCRILSIKTQYICDMRCYIILLVIDLM